MARDRWDIYWEDVRGTHETLKALDVEHARAAGIAEGRADSARELNALTNENVRLAAEIRRLMREANGEGTGEV